MKIYSLALGAFNLDKKIQICDVSNIGIYIGIWHSFCIYMCSSEYVLVVLGRIMLDAKTYF